MKMLNIGGFMGLEIAKAGQPYHQQAIALNLGRNAWRYILRVYHPKLLFMPYYTCPVLWQVAEAEGLHPQGYGLDADWLPTREFPQSAYVLYTNYFGLMQEQINNLARQYPNLIVDNAQAFYAPPRGKASFYSARKFCGVADGAYLYISQSLPTTLAVDLSTERSLYLLRRLESSFNDCYTQYQQQERLLAKVPLRQMSRLTQRLLTGLDYTEIKQQRRCNFQILQQQLQHYNELSLTLNADAVPMAYPLLYNKPGLGEYLMRQGVYITRYWEDLPKIDEVSQYWRQHLLALPIDQRYDVTDMQQIVRLIANYK